MLTYTRHYSKRFINIISIFTISPWAYYYSHFTEEETEAWKGRLIGPRSLATKTQSWGSNLPSLAALFTATHPPLPQWHGLGSLPFMLPRWHSDKESACQCRRHVFNPWVRKMPWRRKWQSTPVCFPGKFHEQRLKSMGLQSVGTTEHKYWLTVYPTLHSVSSPSVHSSCCRINLLKGQSEASASTSYL